MFKNKTALALEVLGLVLVVLAVLLAASSHVSRMETQYANDLREAKSRISDSEVIVDSLRAQSDASALVIDSLEVVAAFHRLESADFRNRLLILLAEIEETKINTRYEGPDSSLASDALRAFRQRSN